VSLLSLSAPAPVSCNPTCQSPPSAPPTHRPPPPRSHTSFAAAADPHAGPYPLPPHIVLPPSPRRAAAGSVRSGHQTPYLPSEAVCTPSSSPPSLPVVSLYTTAWRQGRSGG
jgi:hypothetical protein